MEPLEPLASSDESIVFAYQHVLSCFRSSVFMTGEEKCDDQSICTMGAHAIYSIVEPPPPPSVASLLVAMPAMPRTAR